MMNLFLGNGFLLPHWCTRESFPCIGFNCRTTYNKKLWSSSLHLAIVSYNWRKELCCLSMLWLVLVCSKTMWKVARNCNLLCRPTRGSLWFLFFFLSSFPPAPPSSGILLLVVTDRRSGRISSPLLALFDDSCEILLLLLHLQPCWRLLSIRNVSDYSYTSSRTS